MKNLLTTLCACVNFQACFTLPHFLQPSKKFVEGRLLPLFLDFGTFLKDHSPIKFWVEQIVQVARSSPA